MIKTEDVRLDLFKLEQMILDKKHDGLFTKLSKEELDELYHAIKRASDTVSSIVTDEMEEEDLADILYEAGAGSLDEYLMEIDEDTELSSLYYS